jgi:hypothetical protein
MLSMTPAVGVSSRCKRAVSDTITAYVPPPPLSDQ